MLERMNDRRRDDRYRTVLRVAKLTRAGADELCVVRNISSGGIRAQLYSPLSKGELVAIEFRSGVVLQASAVWQSGEDAGLEFAEPVNLAEVLRTTPADHPAWHPRQPRLSVRECALLRQGAALRPVQLCDISQGGAKVEPHSGCMPDGRVVLRLAGLPPVDGSVRWSDAQHVGVAFDAPIPVAALGRWLVNAAR